MTDRRTPIERMVDEACGLTTIPKPPNIKDGAQLMLDVFDAFVWCRQHNAMVRFHGNSTVTVQMNGSRRRRKTLAEAALPMKPRLPTKSPSCP